MSWVKLPDFRINDDWILDRVSSQSNSFSQWLSNIMKGVEKTLETVPPEMLGEVKKEEIFESLKDADKQLAAAQDELAKLGFLGKKLSKKLLNFITF